MTDTQTRRWFAFRPGRDTVLAAASIPAFTLVYFLNANYGYDHPAIFFIGFVLIGHLILNTALPAYVVMKMREEGLAGLGLTTRRWKLSLLISAIAAAMVYVPFKQALATFEGDPVPHILFNATALWEPLFVFGWLQLRFERAFGILAGIVLAGLAFAIYHIGSFPTDALFGLFFAGVFYSALFAITRSLLVVLPLAWGVSSSMGTMQGGFAFDWPTVAIYAVVLIAQAVILYALWKRSQTAGSGSA